MRACLRPFVAACLTFACASAAQAEPMAYAAGFDSLYRIDLATGRATRVGDFGSLGGNALIADVEGLALAPDGTLFGVSDSQKVLVRVNTATGAATLVGTLREAGQPIGNEDNLDFGLAFTCDGRLWLSSDKKQRLWEIDPATGQARSVGATGANISGLAARGNRLVGLGAEGTEGLYYVDRDTGAATLMARLSPNAAFADGGLDFDTNGNLWGVRDFFPPEGRADVFRIDLANGALSGVVNVSFAAGTQDKEIETIAIAPPGACSSTNPIGPPPTGVQPGAAAVPASSPLALTLLGALVALVAVLALRRRAAR